VINRPWIGLVLISLIGLLLLVAYGLSSDSNFWAGLPGPVFFFIGWVVVSAVIWLALISAAWTAIGKSAAVPIKRTLAASNVLAAGIQAAVFLIPNAAASFAWESQSEVILTLTTSFVLSGPVLVLIALVLIAVSFFEVRRLRGRTSVRIRVEHMEGSWPVWFESEIMDEVDKAPISIELKAKGIAISEFFDSVAIWDDANSRFQWTSEADMQKFNNGMRVFATELSQQLGSGYFVSAPIQKSNRRVVELEHELFFVA
jgi:hypothetical protein